MTENEAQLKQQFTQARGRIGRLASTLVGDDAAEQAVNDAEIQFSQMLPSIAYRDNPNHPHAGDLFSCAINLALFLAIKDQGIDEHQFGRAMIRGITKALAAQKDSAHQSESTGPSSAEAFVESLRESERSAKPGEFVYEYLPDESNEATGDWAFNIKTCAICHHFGKYDAMDLVPYMCASDDVVSDAQGRGLARNGTIALGAHHCDFRFKAGGEPNRVADQYPERIHLQDL